MSVAVSICSLNHFKCGPRTRAMVDIKEKNELVVQYNI